MPAVVERTHGEQQVAVQVIELDARADAAPRQLAAQTGTQVNTALRRDRVRQRRHVGLDSRAVQPEIDKNLGGGRRRQRGQHSCNDSRELRGELGWIRHRVARLETDESAEARVGVAEHVATERELGADEQSPQRPAVARVDWRAVS